MLRRIVPALLLASLGCSVRSMAVNAVADSLAQQGDVFARDEDPELVREAIPFGLKTYESVLEAAPDHRGLLLATGSGFIQYAYAFVAREADEIDADDIREARRLRARAKKLFLRGRDYVLRGIELQHPGFVDDLRRDPAGTMERTRVSDAPFLYWAGTGWTAALMVEKGDLGLVADLPLAGALLLRSAELDPAYKQGAAHEILVSYEGGRSEAMGGSAAKAREHYAKALALSGGRRASVHLALAESVAVREQNLGEFKALLEKALAVDPDADPSQRLVNVLARRRAIWLNSRIPDLFLEAEEENP